MTIHVLLFITFYITGLITGSNKIDIKEGFTLWKQHIFNQAYSQKGIIGALIVTIAMVVNWISVIIHEIWHGIIPLVGFFITVIPYKINKLNWTIAPSGMEYIWKKLNINTLRKEGAIYKNLFWQNVKPNEELFINKLSACAPFLFWVFFMLLFSVRFLVYFNVEDLFMICYLSYAWYNTEITLSESDLELTWPIFTAMYISNPQRLNKEKKE
jgi:hypothetical protein